MKNYKTPIIMATLLVILAAIPAAFFLAQTPQNVRSKAAASSTLYYMPASSPASPIQKSMNTDVALDVMLNPGTNMASLVKLEMNYDPNYFTPATNPFVVNSAAFPTTVEGPVALTGKVVISVSIGSDSTKAVKTVTKVGTLYLKTRSLVTNGSPAVITFGPNSQVFSVAAQDQATENVLSTTNPAYISILGLPTPTPTPTRVPTATPLPTRIPTPTMTPTPLPTETPIPQATLIDLSIALHGIGNSGDNANPTASDFSNKNPLHQDHEVSVDIYNDQNVLVLSKTGIVVYDGYQGTYRGTIDLGILPNNVYSIRVKEQNHLRKLIPGFQLLDPAQTNVMPEVDLTAGDTNNDNVLNILDYNMLVGCYSDLLPATNCDATRKTNTDLNDDGSVNQFDYNLFMREITVQAGN